ncbi:hypothetical protein BC936DRAFT_143738, partial [Jimgerdemannia flammicorona]
MLSPEFIGSIRKSSIVSYLLDYEYTDDEKRYLCDMFDMLADPLCNVDFRVGHTNRMQHQERVGDHFATFEQMGLMKNSKSFLAPIIRIILREMLYSATPIDRMPEFNFAIFTTSIEQMRLDVVRRGIHVWTMPKRNQLAMEWYRSMQQLLPAGVVIPDTDTVYAIPADFYIGGGFDCGVEIWVNDKGTNDISRANRFTLKRKIVINFISATHQSSIVADVETKYYNVFARADGSSFRIEEKQDDLYNRFIRCNEKQLTEQLRLSGKFDDDTLEEIKMDGRAFLNIARFKLESRLWISGDAADKIVDYVNEIRKYDPCDGVKSRNDAFMQNFDGKWYKHTRTILRSPTSSGKTTFAQNFKRHLVEIGRLVLLISMDQLLENDAKAAKNIEDFDKYWSERVGISFREIWDTNEKIHVIIDDADALFWDYIPFWKYFKKENKYLRVLLLCKDARQSIRHSNTKLVDNPIFGLADLRLTRDDLRTLNMPDEVQDAIFNATNGHPGLVGHIVDDLEHMQSKQ